MNKIIFDLEYCHGINKLHHEFEFNKSNSYVIYAPNGTMKTSFTKTLLDLKNGLDSKDNIFPYRNSKRNILKSDGSKLLPGDILIVESFKDNYESSKITTLLASKNLKQEYDNINNKIIDKKNELLTLLSRVSGVGSKYIESQISYDLTNGPNKLLQCLSDIYENKSLEHVDDLSYLKYSSIINNKVELFIKDKDVKNLLEEYIKTYNELIDNSKFFKKGIFNHTNATTISKHLSDNGFFGAKYKLIMSDEENHIKSKKELDDLISLEKKEILSNEELSSKFEKIDKRIKNKELYELRDILEKNQELISELYNYNIFKQKIWKSYLKYNQSVSNSYISLIELYNNYKDKLKEILKKAQEERTKWDNVVSIFNNRFDVPFIVEIENQEDVILKETTPTLIFKYKDKDNVSEKRVTKNDLLNVLSQGEKRAFYIMQIVFELEAIKEENNKTLLVFDDIADSFDYKNKYAIVEYLNEINNRKDIFNMIILTHNFDFYRTIAKRLKPRCLMTIKSNTEINIIQGNYIGNVFNQWKKTFYKNDRILIASIPFIRNISEYIDGNNSDEYVCLTNLLHMKPYTDKIKVKKLEEIFKNLWHTDKSLNKPERFVLDVIFEQANEICSEQVESLNLENKIVLSIAIRLKAEIYMFSKINSVLDSIQIIEFNNSLKNNQTGKLLSKFKGLFKNDIDTIKILDQVNLMTSENIHINSFMYEPLLDLSETHLKSLYNKIQKLIDNDCLDIDLVTSEIAYN